jgi:HSP20 family molecular chaperone IbpA
MRILFILFVIILSFSTLAAANKKEQNEFDQMQEREMEMIRRLLGADHFKQMDERLEMLMKKFMQNSGNVDDIDKFFDRSHFDKFMQDWNPHQGLGDGESHWLETPTERILILKLQQSKDSPIDIKIQNNIINVSGKNVLKTAQGSSISTYSKSEGVPDDVDANSAEIENKNGDVQIRFKKKGAQKIVAPKAKPAPDKRPIKKHADDEVI